MESVKDASRDRKRSSSHRKKSHKSSKSTGDKVHKSSSSRKDKSSSKGKKEEQQSTTTTVVVPNTTVPAVATATPVVPIVDKVQRDKPVKRSRIEAESETSEEHRKKKPRKQADGLQRVACSMPEIKAFQEENNITVYGDSSVDFTPFRTFQEVNAIYPTEFQAYTKKFSKPTPIQAQTWPLQLAKLDVVGIAETGSGKTLAFGLPALLHILQKRKGSEYKVGGTMLVLAPTRELAQQSHDVLLQLGDLCTPKIFTVCIYGGVHKSTQRSGLKKADVIVACPGRLLDLMEEGCCDLSNITYLVLDEADRMLDMGFEPAIRKIISAMPVNRQTVMFSATWPKSVQVLAKDFLAPSFVRVVVGAEKLAANGRVQQLVEVTRGHDIRKKRLLELVSQYYKKGKIIIFVLYKAEAPMIQKFLNYKQFSCDALHGNLSSIQRANALENFKKGTPPIMIATDVAARGLDIPNVEYVINYSFPLTVEDYVHRIGRTGRAGASGVSHTFFEPHDKHLCGSLVGVLRQAKANIPEDLLAFGTTTKRKEPKLGRIVIPPAGQASGHITFGESSEEESSS